MLTFVNLGGHDATGNIPQWCCSSKWERLCHDCVFLLYAGRWEDVCGTEATGGHLLAGTGAAAVGVRFKVKPARSNWQNNSRCPALEIRGSNRGVYFRQGYTKCFLLDDTCFFFLSAVSSRPPWARGINLFLSFQSRPAKDVLGEIGKVSVLTQRPAGNVFGGFGKMCLTSIGAGKLTFQVFLRCSFSHMATGKASL